MTRFTPAIVLNVFSLSVNVKLAEIQRDDSVSSKLFFSKMGSLFCENGLHK